MPVVSGETVQNFLKLKQSLQINPVYFHAMYLVNFADADRIGKFSVQTLITELKLANRLGVKGSIIHLGSFKSHDKPTKDQYNILLQNIQEVLDKTPDDTYFIIENAGNRKICCSLEELGFIVKELNSQRVRVCLDTCHMYAAGFSISTTSSFQQFFTSFDKSVGMEKLEVFQVNDSKGALGSFLDRHENIGEGQMTLEPFRLLLNNPLTKHLPMIIETPGFDRKGPDKKNLDILKSLVAD